MSEFGPKRGILAEDLYRLRFAHRVAISPDGTQVAFTTMIPDAASNHNRFSMYVVPTGGGDSRVLWKMSRVTRFRVGHLTGPSSPLWSNAAGVHSCLRLTSRR